MIAFLTTLALKATLWTTFCYLAALAIPIQHVRARRLVTLVGLWGLWIVPWLPLPAWQSASSALTTSAVIKVAEGPWIHLAAAVWFVGVLFAFIRLTAEAVIVTRWARRAPERLSVTTMSVEVRFSHDIDGPCLTGWWHPCVLLPFEAKKWPTQTLQAALRHEIQHARQHDGLHRICAAAQRALFWWNPALHALTALYETESEVCCDLAATSGLSPRQYGEMLLAHATLLPTGGFAMPFARRSGLRRRIQRLITPSKPPGWLVSTRWFAALVLIAAAGVVTASIHVAGPTLLTEGEWNAESQLRLKANPFPGSP